MSTTDEKEERFEDSLARLEALIRELDNGDLPLERSLEVYEESVKLLRKCQAKLEHVQQRIEVLERERNQVRVVPYAPQARNDQNPNPNPNPNPLPATDDDIPF
jgi:exodeoxyribonuclease VII small subunit